MKTGHLRAVLKDTKETTIRILRYILIALALGLSLAIVLSLSRLGNPNTMDDSDNKAPASPSITENPRYIYEDGAIHVGADGKPIELINNPNAINPTYAELAAFVRADDTDTELYLEQQIGGLQPFVCADYAEAVHNNAETKGIRAASVGIDLRDNEDGHALNAFETTDRGLVYVDCTGNTLAFKFMPNATVSQSKSIDGPPSRDKIAYVEVGKIYERYI